MNNNAIYGQLTGHLYLYPEVGIDNQPLIVVVEDLLQSVATRFPRPSIFPDVKPRIRRTQTHPWLHILNFPHFTFCTENIKERKQLTLLHLLSLSSTIIVDKSIKLFYFWIKDLVNNFTVFPFSFHSNITHQVHRQDFFIFLLKITFPDEKWCQVK